MEYQFKVIPINKFGYENVSHDIGDGFKSKKKALKYFKEKQTNFIGTILKYFKHDLEYYSRIDIVLTKGEKVVRRYGVYWR